MDRSRGGRGRGRGRERGRSKNLGLSDEMSQMNLEMVMLRGGERLARKARDLTHLTFQCNDCSGEYSHDSNCDQRLVH